MYEEGENKFYYITTMNENYPQPDMPEGVEEGIIKGMYCLKRDMSKKKLGVQLLGSGTILREVEAAAEILENDYDVAANIWSLTSINEIQREGKAVVRWNLLHPESEAKLSYVAQMLGDGGEPCVIATDYMKSYGEQIREFVPARLTVLGTDGYGRSDTRERLREFFEVSREYVVIAALKSLADEGSIKPSVVTQAMRSLGISPDKIDPVSV
jgi:pyruvate dehydrogenase E1 component